MPHRHGRRRIHRGRGRQAAPAMATFRKVGTIGSFQEKMIEGMAARGYERDFAERSAFRQIEGFGEYGFPESHAASFALLVYASAWLKCHYPDVFCAAILNAQPMGFSTPRPNWCATPSTTGVEIAPSTSTSRTGTTTWSGAACGGPSGAPSPGDGRRDLVEPPRRPPSASGR